MQQIVIVLLAVILHMQSIARVSCKTGKNHQKIHLNWAIGDTNLNEHIPNEYCRMVHAN